MAALWIWIAITSVIGTLVLGYAGYIGFVEIFWGRDENGLCIGHRWVDEDTGDHCRIIHRVDRYLYEADVGDDVVVLFHADHIPR